jgi:hypothetical protein
MDFLLRKKTISCEAVEQEETEKLTCERQGDPILKFGTATPTNTATSSENPKIFSE